MEKRDIEQIIQNSVRQPDENWMYSISPAKYLDCYEGILYMLGEGERPKRLMKHEEKILRESLNRFLLDKYD